MSDPEEDRPISFVVFALIGVILLLGWAAMASSYANESPSLAGARITPRSSGVGMLVSLTMSMAYNAIVYVPQCFSVLKHTFTEMIVIPVVMAVAIVGVLGLAVWMKKLEADLADPSAAYRRNRKR